MNEHHPLVKLAPESLEDACLSLLHNAAYHTASKYAVDRRVLDVGCNIGYGSAILADVALSVTGVDVSPTAVEAARNHFVSSNLEFIQVDGASLPFEDERFDVVTSFQVIEHVDDVTAYLAEIHRVMKPNAIAIFTTPNRLIRLDDGMKPWNIYHVREYSPSQLKSDLSSQFSAVTVQGLFAIQEIYDLEFNRVDSARRKARSRGRQMARGFYYNVLPVWLQRLVAQAREGIFSRAKSIPDVAKIRAFMDRASFDDIYYKEEGIEKSLDLLGFCNK